MAAKLTRLIYKTEIQLDLMAEGLPFVVLAPGGQSGNFWIQRRVCVCVCLYIQTVKQYVMLTHICGLMFDFLLSAEAELKTRLHKVPALQNRTFQRK